MLLYFFESQLNYFDAKVDKESLSAKMQTPGCFSIAILGSTLNQNFESQIGCLKNPLFINSGTVTVISIVQWSFFFFSCMHSDQTCAKMHKFLIKADLRDTGRSRQSRRLLNWPFLFNCSSYLDEIRQILKEGSSISLNRIDCL